MRCHLGYTPPRPIHRAQPRREDYPRSFRHAGQPSPVVVRGTPWTRGEYARFLVVEGGYDYDQAADLADLPLGSVIQVSARPYTPPRSNA